MYPLIVGFSKPRNRTFPIGSYLIRFYERSEYSHVYLRVYIPEVKKYVIYEAVGHGIRFISQDQWEKTAESVREFTVPISENQNRALVAECFNNCGKLYGFWQNIGIFIAEIFNLNHNPFTKYRNCSEEVAKRLSDVGISFKKPINLISPKDLYEYFNENKDL